MNCDSGLFGQGIYPAVILSLFFFIVVLFCPSGSVDGNDGRSNKSSENGLDPCNGAINHKIYVYGIFIVIADIWYSNELRNPFADGVPTFKHNSIECAEFFSFFSFCYAEVVDNRKIPRKAERDSILSLGTCTTTPVFFFFVKSTPMTQSRKQFIRRRERVPPVKKGFREIPNSWTSSLATIGI